MVLSILTAGRPGAVVDLTPTQRNRSAGTLDLNPPDHAQNKKYRPMVRQTRVLGRFLAAWEKAGLGSQEDRYCGYTTVEGAKSALERLGADGTPKLSTYSGRHKATTVLRRARVPEDQIATQLGHRRPSLRITGAYGEWDPTYLQDAARALDKWFLKVRKMARALAKSQENHKAKHQSKTDAA
jgi:integrase